eukprot:TRINITY_DN19522_c0_g1_i1.p3 TRINITY_DN19522_c0_g1~~TRINITY_DN19522_c0_g1_i1.p3  ORF type:complete len:121 (-),score=9.32 TRINITY_DN19522_c0_g1_i1:262-624(-)
MRYQYNNAIGYLDINVQLHGRIQKDKGEGIPPYLKMEYKLCTNFLTEVQNSWKIQNPQSPKQITQDDDKERKPNDKQKLSALGLVLVGWYILFQNFGTSLLGLGLPSSAKQININSLFNI